MSSRMRVTKGHSGNRRSHHALKAPRLSLCRNCGEYHKRHRVCLSCGFYRGRLILESKNSLVKKAEDKEVKKDSSSDSEVKKEEKSK